MRGCIKLKEGIKRAKMRSECHRKKRRWNGKRKRIDKRFLLNDRIDSSLPSSFMLFPCVLDLRALSHSTKLYNFCPFSVDDVSIVTKGGNSVRESRESDIASYLTWTQPHGGLKPSAQTCGKVFYLIKSNLFKSMYFSLVIANLPKKKLKKQWAEEEL